MSASNGYGSVVMSGSVFMFDTGDTYNSYIGEPTTNICTGVAYSIYDSGATNYRNQTSPSPPVPGYEVVKVVANTPGTYGQSILWRAPYATNVMTATNSVYAWLESGTYVQVGQHWFPWNYGSPKYIPTGQWVRISETYTINEGGSYGSAAMVYSTDGIAYFSMPQYEIKPHMTPFIGFDQTRSNTQGLLPLVGNSTIDLANMTYDSNAQIVFDGTDDVIYAPSCNSLGGLSEQALEIIVKTPGLGAGNSIGGLICPDYGQISYIAGNGNIVYYLYSTDAGYPGTYVIILETSGVNIFDNKWHHIVCTRGNAGCNIYVDGVSKASGAGGGTWSGSNIWSNMNTSIGNNPNNVGYYLNGNIAVAKIYKKYLSASEVQQNYQKYKTRFNLS